MEILDPDETRLASCPDCGKVFVDISTHWVMSDTCSRPDLTPRQRELAIGLVMGDGSLSKRGGNGHLTITNTNARFLEWIDEQFGVMSCGVRLAATADQQAATHRHRDFFRDDAEFKDIYRLHLRTHSFFTSLRETWYPADEIRFPADLSLTPESVKMWYVSDGSLKWNQSKNASAVIASKNESARGEFLEGLLEEHGFSPQYKYPYLSFSIMETPEFLEWLGDPVPGMEYKWAIDSKKRYDEIKP